MSDFLNIVFNVLKSNDFKKGLQIYLFILYLLNLAKENS